MVVDVSGNLTGTLPDDAAAVAAVVLIHSQTNDHTMNNCPLTAKRNKQIRNTFKNITPTKFMPHHPSAWTSVRITNTNFLSTQKAPLPPHRYCNYANDLKSWLLNLWGCINLALQHHTSLQKYTLNLLAI
jgi:hypothetical protein